jgi:hypothetical protein
VLTSPVGVSGTVPGPGVGLVEEEQAAKVITASINQHARMRASCI